MFGATCVPAILSFSFPAQAISAPAPLYARVAIWSRGLSIVRRMSSQEAIPTPCIFFDLDDCLYKNNWATAKLLTAKINDYCVSTLGLPDGKAYELFKKYGTALRGLVEEKLIKDEEIDMFLDEVHDISLDDIERDDKLRDLLISIPHERWVFTASTETHAERCLARLNIADLFVGTVSASSRKMFDKVGVVTKHDPRCFAAAMDVAGIPSSEPGRCMLLDDSVRNLKTAKEMGWRTVLVGLHARDTGDLIQCEFADFAVGTIHEIEDTVPELFTVCDSKSISPIAGS
eukprot:TRINITY_DN44776_c0_g1_i1.p1 TRINITY_DN44776_c0_g1~~TRINITY_DN44776_c0_g1_i1.p1  ORF type:complete len:288 (+),score=44.44 TRINITY_DN44776_c0_g1_i1:3-866(+)